MIEESFTMGQCILNLSCDCAVKHTSTMISPSADHLMVSNTNLKPLERYEQEFERGLVG